MLAIIPNFVMVEGEEILGSRFQALLTARLMVIPVFIKTVGEVVFLKPQPSGR